MKWALVGPVYPYRGGIAHYTTRLYRTLVEREPAHAEAVLLVSFRRQYPPWLFPGSDDRDPSRSPLRPQTAHYWLDSLNPLTWWTTAQRIARWQPDLLVLQWWTSFWTPVWLALLMGRRLAGGGPVAIICHNVLPHEARPWDRLAARLVLGQATGCIVHTEAEQARLAALLPTARIEVIPHPVYDHFAGPGPDATAARQALGLPASGPLLLFFGMVREYKGLDDLLAALPVARAALPDLHLVVAGDFWGNLDHYRRQAHALDVAAAVSFHDRYVPDEEVPLYFAAADLLVAPYRRATGSGVMQTARGLGTPVIATDVTLPSAAARDDWTGGFVPPNDPAALAEAIIAFFRNPSQPIHRAAPQAVDASWTALAGALLRAAGLMERQTIC
ncbi:MAG TPA: glycosyltransferase [Caldilineaceae bacterium]|nr:glycosyltransferase [Caldilineaceae bacterium]